MSSSAPSSRRRRIRSSTSGAAPGHIGRFVRDAGRQVVGIDLSVEMAALAGARLDGAAVGDMRSLPVASRSLGGIVAFYSLIHIPRQEIAALFGELHRVLRPGGRLLFTAHAGDGELEVDELLGSPVRFAATLFGLDELVGSATGAGFEVVTAERRPPYPDEHPTDRVAVEVTK